MKYLKKIVIVALIGIVAELTVFNIDYWCQYFVSGNNISFNYNEMMAEELGDFQNENVKSGGLLYIPSEQIYVRNVIVNGESINDYTFVYTNMSGVQVEVKGVIYNGNETKFVINDRINGVSALKNNSEKVESKKNVYVTFNSTRMNFSIWRVLAILIVYEGFSLLYLIQAPINYHLEDE